MKNLFLLIASLFVITIEVNAQWTQPSQVSWNSQNVYCFLRSGTNIYAGTGSAGVSLSSDNGGSWTAVNTGLLSTGISGFAQQGSSIFAGGNGVFMTNNNGASWTYAMNGITDSTINTLAVNGSKIYAGTRKGVFVSENNGVLWNPIDSGIKFQIRSLAFIDSNIFAGAPNRGVYRSTNNGKLWTLVNNGLSNKDVTSLTIIGTTLYAGTTGGVYISNNKGGLWNSINNGLTGMMIHTLFANDTTLFAGTDSGVFYTANKGSLWTQFNTGFPPNTAVQAFTASNTHLFAGMRLNPYGVWRRSLSEVNGITDRVSDVNFRIYPNPTSNLVNLEVDVEMNGDLFLQVYDLTGKLVKTEILKPWNRKFETVDLTRGFYSIVIHSENRTGIQKLLIE